MTRRATLDEVRRLLECSRSPSPFIAKTIEVVQEAAGSRATKLLGALVPALEALEDRDARAAAALLRDILPPERVAALVEDVQALAPHAEAAAPQDLPLPPAGAAMDHVRRRLRGRT